MDGSEFLERRHRDWRWRGRTVAGACGVDAVGPWLGTAERVEISTAGLSIAGRYILVACKHLLDGERDRICDAALLYLAREQRRPVSRTIFCVRTVSETRWNLGQTMWFMGPPGDTSCLRVVVDPTCVGGFRCASAHAAGIYFQACSFKHSDISPCKWSQQFTGRRGST